MGGYDDVLGPLLLSAFLNTYFYGLTFFQYATYHNTVFNDRPSLKAVVATMFAVDTCQSILAIYLVWVSCVKSYVASSEISHASIWAYTMIPIFASFSGLFVHLFLAGRILDLTQKRVMGYCLMFGGLTSCGLGFALGIFGLVKQLSISEIIDDSTLFHVLALVWLCIQVALNLILAGTLIYIYDKIGEKISTVLPQFTKAWSILVKCNFFGTTCCLLILILLVASLKSTAWFVLLMPMGRMYTATILTWLLAREKSSDSMQTKSFHHGTSKVQWKVPSNRRFSRSQSFKMIQIRTEREVVVDSSPDRTSESSKDGVTPLPDVTDDEMRVLRVQDGSHFNKKRILPVGE